MRASVAAVRSCCVAGAPVFVGATPGCSCGTDLLTSHGQVREGKILLLLRGSPSPLALAAALGSWYAPTERRHGGVEPLQTFESNRLAPDLSMECKIFGNFFPNKIIPKLAVSLYLFYFFEGEQIDSLRLAVRVHFPDNIPPCSWGLAPRSRTCCATARYRAMGLPRTTKP